MVSIPNLDSVSDCPKIWSYSAETLLQVALFSRWMMVVTSLHARFGHIIIQHSESLQQCRRRLSVLHVRSANVSFSNAASMPEAAEKKKEECKLFSDHNGSLLRRQPRAPEAAALGRICYLLLTSFSKWQKTLKDMQHMPSPDAIDGYECYCIQCIDSCL